ncbi:hypothetical protein ES705_06314 [subsurface metagenome]
MIIIIDTNIAFSAILNTKSIIGDLNDIVFVALNEYQKSILWTGDKVLINGLNSIGYDKVITTDKMIKLRSRLEKNN